MMKTIQIIYKIILAGIILINSNNIFSQEQGDIKITHYLPQDYGANMQNWAAIQDTNGIMYFGNNDGVLKYDGNNWYLIKVNADNTVRSFDVNNNTVYVGGVGSFGYLKENDSREMEYVSLSDSLSDADKIFHDIWFTRSVNDEVWFCSYNIIFRYKNGDITTWHSPNGSFKSLHNINNRVLIFDDNEGILEMINDSLSRLPVSDLLIGRWFWTTEYLKSNKFLITISREGLFTIDLEEEDPNLALKKFNTEADSLFTSHIIYSLERLNNGNLAVGLISKGVVILDNDGNLVRILDRQTGLKNNIISYLYQDIEGNLWMTTLDGISKINTNSTISSWEDRFGVQPFVNDIARYNGTLYFADYRGVSYIKKNDVIHIETINTACFDIQEITDPIDTTRKRLLVGTNFHGVMEVDNQGLKEFISANTVYKIHQSQSSLSRLFIGSVDGLYVSEFHNRKWGIPLKVEGINNQVRLIHEDDNGYIWINQSNNELWQIIPSSNLIIPLKINKYISKIEFPESMNIVQFNDRLLFPSINGLLFLDSTNKKITEDSTVFKELNNASIISLEPNYRNELTFFAHQNNKFVSGIIKDSETIIWDNQWLHCLPEMQVSCVIYDNDSTIWVGGSLGLFRIHQKQKIERRNYYTRINKITVNNDSMFYLTSELERFKLSHKLNSISFQYSAMSYYDEEQTVFRTYLEGLDKGWSDWSSENKKEYNYLREGNYIMHVRAKNIFGIESDADPIHFRIYPPWQRSFLAYVIYSLLILSTVWLIVYLNSRRLQKLNMTLENTVVQRTQSLIESNKRLEEHQQELTVRQNEITQKNIELEKLSTVARETDNAIIIADEKGNIEWINEGCFKMYGYTLNEIKSTFKSLPNLARFSSELKHTYQKCIETNDTEMSNSTIRHKSGKEISVHRTMTPILDNSNKITKFVIIDSDITKLNELENYKESLIQMIIHDLKNPLNTIIGFSALKKTLKSFDFINLAGRQMLDMVENILTVHKSETMEVQLSKERVNINYLIDQCVSEVAYLADLKEISIVNEIPHFHLRIDKELIRRVLVNLLSNAIKFSPRNGSVRLAAGIQTIKKKKYLEISIADEGDGIDPKMLDKIFDKYAQADSKKSGKARSTGLGLTFCKLAIEAHKGLIGVKSRLNEGSVFFFTLPITEDIQEFYSSAT